MAIARYYSPQISRFLVSALYHEAKRRKMPMIRLVDELLRQHLGGSKSWQKAEELKVAEESPAYIVGT